MQEAERAGQHCTALEHALQAWQLDPSQPGYLAKMADEAALCGDLEQADRAYEQWLGLPNRDVTRDGEMRSRQEVVRNRKQAKAKAEQASVLAAKGQHGEAQRLFEEAWRLDSGQLSYLQSAGLEALEAGNREQAVLLLRQFLAQAPANHPGRLRAQEIVLNHPPQEPVAPPWSARKRGAVWSAAGAGALLLAAGGFGIGYGLAAGRVAEKQAQLTNPDHSLWRADELLATSRCNTAIGLGMASLVAGGAAAWLWWGAPEANEAAK